MSITIFQGVPWGVYKYTQPDGGGTTQPRVLSAVSTGVNTVRVTFDRTMNFDFNPRNTGLIATNYQIQRLSDSVALDVLRVTKITDTVVDILTVDQEGVSYRLTVLSATDVWDNDIDPLYDTYDFGGTAPIFPSIDDVGSFFGLEGGMQHELNADITPDVDPPVLQNQDPPPGDTNVSALTNITLELVDDGDGVDKDSVILTVEGAVAWQNDAEQSGFHVAKTAISGGFRYVINPDIPLPTGTVVDIDVYAEDLSFYRNALSTSYYFTTQATSAPDITVISPGENTTGISENTTIEFEATDINFDLDPSKTLVSVNLVLAYSNLLPQNGFAVTRTTIAGGYNYIITPPRPFPFGYEVRVDLVCGDYSANIVGKTYSFTTRNADYCFDGPLNSFEQRLQSGFSSGLVALEHLRLLLLDRVTKGLEIEPASRSIFLRAFQSDLFPVMLRLVPQPTLTEQAVRICGWSTAVDIYNPVASRFHDLIATAIRELQGLGLPREHAAMFVRQSNVRDATVLVNLACVLVMLGKALDSTELV